MKAQDETVWFGETCTWKGRSSRPHRFYVYDLDAPTLELDGVFILAAPGDLFTAFYPLFIGRSVNISQHLVDCPELPAAAALGATTLHLWYARPGAPSAHDVWADLLGRHAPPLNHARAGFAPNPHAPRGEVIAFPRRRLAAQG